MWGPVSERIVFIRTLRVDERKIQASLMEINLNGYYTQGLISKKKKKNRNAWKK